MGCSSRNIPVPPPSRAPGAKPSVRSNGQAGAVQCHIKGQGDLLVCEAGTSNRVYRQAPPPKQVVPWRLA